MKSLFIPLLAITVLFTSCEEILPCGFSKENFLDNYANFLSKIEDGSEDFDKATWEKHDERFKKFASECYKSYENDMSIDEKQEFWTDAVVYLRNRYGVDLLTEFNNPDNELVQIVKENGVDMVEAIWDVIKREFMGNNKIKNAWENLKKEVQNAFENVEKEFSK